MSLLMLLNVLLSFWCTYFFGFLTYIGANEECKMVDTIFKNTCRFFVFTFAPMKAFQTYFCVKLQCILDLFCHLVKKLSILLDFNIFIFIFGGSVHAVRSCLPLLTKAISHLGIRGHWVKRGLWLATGTVPRALMESSLGAKIQQFSTCSFLLYVLHDRHNYCFEI